MQFVRVKGVIKQLWEQLTLFGYDHCYDRTDLGTINYIDNFFRQKPTFFDVLLLKNDQILDLWQNLSKITFFAGKRSGGVGLCPKR